MENKRKTIQKIKILSYLKSVKTHPSAETVYQEVKKDLPTISLGTIYRNLNNMALNGEILKIEVNNESRYDFDTSEHGHSICRKCNCVIDVFNKKISRKFREEFDTDNFKLESIRVIAYGICKKCRG